jgi:ribosome-associated protein
MLVIRPHIGIPLAELQFSAIRSQGAGGQNVNKVSTAIHLRFDIHRSSLPEVYKQRLLESSDQRINKDGEIIIKAQSYRSQEKNKQDALDRLQQLIQQATQINKQRRPTKATKGSQKRRMDSKTRHGKTKSLRAKPTI